jgi:hypothetical protein
MIISKQWARFAAVHPLLPDLMVIASAGILWAAVQWIPTGRPTTMSGRVLAMGLGSAKYPHPWARVSLPGREVTFDTYTVLSCSVGDVLEVRRQRHVWGSSFSAIATRCTPANRIVSAR